MKEAIKFMIISAFAFTLLNVFVKSLKQFDVYQIVFFRSIGTLFFTVPLILKNKILILGNKKGLLISRSIVGFAAMTLFFMSLKHLPMGSAVSIRYISPIFGAFFAFILLKEKIKYIQWFYFSIAFIGVVILKGFDNQVNNIGLLYIIISTVLTGLVYIIIRKIGNKDHPLVIINYYMLISVAISGILSIKYWINPKGVEWLLLISLAIFGYFAQYYMTKAMQSSEVNFIAPLKYIEVVFTMLIGVIWLGETYTIISVFGIFLIIIGLILNVRVKSQSVN